MTTFTSGTTFAVCVALALLADSWADKPLPVLVGAGVALGVVVVLAGLARGREDRLSRRNLQKFQGAELALKMEEAVAAKAQARMRAGINQHSSPLQKSEKGSPIHTDETLAQMAGVSRDTAQQSRTQKKTAPCYSTRRPKQNRKSPKQSIYRDYTRLRGEMQP